MLSNLFALVDPLLEEVIKYGRPIIVIMLLVLAVIMTVTILMQPASESGLGALSGQTDTFYAKNKGKTREGLLRKITTGCAIAMGVLALIYFISLAISQVASGGAVI